MEIKLRPPSLIRATYKIVTPMFIGDANQKLSGISPASFKGALRFWWRASQWPAIRSQSNFASDPSALKELHRQENSLFGSAAAENSQQSKVNLHLAYKGKEHAFDTERKDGLKYLMGQGLFDFKKGFLRHALGPDTFDVEIRLRSISPEQQAQVIQSCILLGCLGGLGSRARRGFGSIAIQSMTVNGSSISVPEDTNQLAQELAKVSVGSTTPPFSAFSTHCRVDQSMSGNNPLALLNQIGEEFQLYRSWGRNGNVGKRKAEKNFEKDHDLMYSATLGEKIYDLPQRSVFGLPHNYFFSSNGKKIDLAPGDKNQTRRASPLFIHVHQFPGDTDYAIAVQTMLRSDFLPIGASLKVTGERKSYNVPFKESMIEWTAITNYLDRFKEKRVLL